MVFNLELMMIEDTPYNKKYILEIITRLHSENSMYLRETITPEGKLAFVLEFNPPEWYCELNNEMQKASFYNLQRLMIEKVYKMGFYGTGYLEQEICDCSMHSRKRPRY
tara:strand:+ start:1194 stop:1520 length:327 start_codon:yes stop_codon:yes gene_type:complete